MDFSTDQTNQGDRIHDLNEVYHAVFNAAVKWYNLGLSLGINSTILTNIESTNTDNTICLRKILNHWLGSSHCTWTGICHGLRSPTVQLNNLANVIEETYCNKGDQLFLFLVHVMCHHADNLSHVI